MHCPGKSLAINDVILVTQHPFPKAQFKWRKVVSANRDSPPTRDNFTERLYGVKLNFALGDTGSPNETFLLFLFELSHLGQASYVFI